ncbi:MAG: sensor histidine kinase, partial [Candidatus Zipacnadales bacterium]
TKAIARQVAAQAAELSAGRVQCETHVEAGAEAVLADEVRLLEITAALLRNAITYHPGNPRLTFIVRREGDRVLLELSDDGPGIPPAMVPRLFLPLEQGPADSSTSLRGLGLGLTIASGLARLMAGDLRFRSADGGGATFTIELPAASPPDDAH